MIPNINLLPNLEKKSASSNLLLILISVIALLGLAVLLFQFFNARANLADLQAEQAALQAQRDQLQVEYDILVGSQGGSLEESVAFVERVSYPVSPIMDELQSKLLANTYLRNYAFGDTAVTTTLDFETLTDVSEYVDRLENSPFFSDVQVSGISNFEVSAGQTEEEEATMDYNEIPRYTVNVTLNIDNVYLASASGGVN
jgi:hypothetical protein